MDFFVEGCVLALVSGTIGWGIAFGLSAALKNGSHARRLSRFASHLKHHAAFFLGARVDCHYLFFTASMARGITHAGGSFAFGSVTSHDCRRDI